MFKRGCDLLNHESERNKYAKQNDQEVDFAWLAIDCNECSSR